MTEIEIQITSEEAKEIASNVYMLEGMTEEQILNITNSIAETLTHWTLTRDIEITVY